MRAAPPDQVGDKAPPEASSRTVRASEFAEPLRQVLTDRADHTLLPLISIRSVDIIRACRLGGFNDDLLALTSSSVLGLAPRACLALAEVHDPRAVNCMFDLFVQSRRAEHAQLLKELGDSRPLAWAKANSTPGSWSTRMTPADLQVAIDASLTLAVYEPATGGQLLTEGLSRIRPNQELYAIASRLLADRAATAPRTAILAGLELLLSCSSLDCRIPAAAGMLLLGDPRALPILLDQIARLPKSSSKFLSSDKTAIAAVAGRPDAKSAAPHLLKHWATSKDVAETLRTFPLTHSELQKIAARAKPISAGFTDDDLISRSARQILASHRFPPYISKWLTPRKLSQVSYKELFAVKQELGLIANTLQPSDKTILEHWARLTKDIPLDQKLSQASSIRSDEAEIRLLALGGLTRLKEPAAMATLRLAALDPSMERLVRTMALSALIEAEEDGCTALQYYP